MRILAQDTVNKIGTEVTLAGWVNTLRSHGKIIFIDLRDRSGIIQLVLTREFPDVRTEDVVEVSGLVKARPDEMKNPKIPTGIVEVEVRELKILNKAQDLPFPIDTDGYDINEELRLKYRYLDLRRGRLQRNLKLRSRLIDAVRQYLVDHEFIEIETPLLTKSTPEGSRDFLVPSRLKPGNFYALPQSPQQYKQLLMIAGFERYFQIARCLRDEDLRADRGFEHTQIDIEMSFVRREDVMELDEGMIKHVVKSLGYKLQSETFPVLTYAEALSRFGSDKFDLRTDSEKKQGILAFAWVVDFPFFERPNVTDSGADTWTFTHNPFSAPKPEHKEWLLKKEHIGEILTTQYDLVCNGYEVGGGSLRSHEPEMLEKVFEIIGYEKKEIAAQFGHMLEALRFGAPPHGGLAHGIERLLMTMTHEPYLREVVAFPMTASGQTSVMDAPSRVTEAQLVEVGLALKSSRVTGDVYTHIVNMLRVQGITFESYEHEPVFTARAAARVRNTPLHQGAKALVMMGDGKALMLVIPADLKVDARAFKKTYHIKDLRMATQEEVERFTGIKVGAVPPFGHIFNLPLFVDEKLRDNETIVFNAGSHTQSIAIKESDFERAARPTIGKFSTLELV